MPIQPINQRFLDYIAQRTPGDDDYLIDLKQAATDAGIPAISIGPCQAGLMQILLKLHGSKHVVEVGTLAGYSAISMARDLPPDGRVTTIELVDLHADFAAAWAANSEVADKIEVLCGSGIDALAQMTDNSADACFIDADKENYPLYLDEMRRILRPGSLIMADNAFAFGELLDEVPTDPSVDFVRFFNEYIATQSWLDGTIVTVGDGLWVAVRIKTSRTAAIDANLFSNECKIAAGIRIAVE